MCAVPQGMRCAACTKMQLHAATAAAAAVAALRRDPRAGRRLRCQRWGCSVLRSPRCRCCAPVALNKCICVSRRAAQPALHCVAFIRCAAQPLLHHCVALLALRRRFPPDHLEPQPYELLPTSVLFDPPFTLMHHLRDQGDLYGGWVSGWVGGWVGVAPPALGPHTLPAKTHQIAG